MQATEILALARLKQLLPLVSTDEAVLQRCELLEQAAAKSLEALDAAIAQRKAELSELTKANDRHFNAREKACKDREDKLAQGQAALDMRATQLESERAYVARLKHEYEVKARTYAQFPLPTPMHVFDVMLAPETNGRGKKTPNIFS